VTGTTVYHCPLCEWTHAELPMTADDLTVSLGRPALDVALDRALVVEDEVKAHLSSHSLLEWVQEVQRLNEALEHAKAALAGDNEGIRLWMLDCGQLVEKHRKAATEADTRAAAAEAKLKTIAIVRAMRPTVTMIHCAGCLKRWADEDDCACTCTDTTDPLYERWHVTTVTRPGVKDEHHVPTK